MASFSLVCEVTRSSKGSLIEVDGECTYVLVMASGKS
jgi:hypothetical protein